MKAFGAEKLEAERFRKAASKLRTSNLRYVAQQALASPMIEFFGALTIVGLLTYARTQISAGQLTTGEFTSRRLGMRAAWAARIPSPPKL